ncbi:MAG: S8 family serine peptidase [Gammaproteobacteria bacterium]|nr:S8 family serine peptidase [Gammaproteobacteria bacterium]
MGAAYVVVVIGNSRSRSDDASGARQRALCRHRWRDDRSLHARRPVGPITWRSRRRDRRMEGFVKPEITAPGGHITGLLALDSTIAQEHPEFHDGHKFFLMSGTSQAAAVASGVAALMLQAEPDLSPNDVKCRLMSSARAATRA